MTTLPNFKLTGTTNIAKAFQATNINTFHQATDFVLHLPYGRNSDKERLETVISEGKGTCSTKHAALVQLAQDQAHYEIELILGIFQMNEENTGGVGKVLDANGLAYMPEAHNYIRYNGERFDFTKSTMGSSSPFDVLMEEHVIQPNQITAYKVNYHRSFLKQWLTENGLDKQWTLDEFWAIREACILAISV